MIEKKIRVLLLSIVTLTQATYAQSAFRNYSQKVDGTKLAFDLVAIPGGEFLMGNNEGNDDAKPEHKVVVSPFWMSSHEITWDLFEIYVYKDLEISHNPEVSIPAGVDAIARPTKPYLDMTFGMGKGKHPALAMTQYNAIQFCKWLYARTGVFYRLPTEAEWEYVAKTGETSLPLDQTAWTSENSDGSTHAVGTKSPNKYGIYDLLGNVSEWTYDQYDPEFYKVSAESGVKNPLNLATKLYPHSVRGGSYNSELEYLTPTSRDYSDPSWKQIDPQVPKSNWWLPDAPFVGIRLVRPEKTPTKEEILSYYDKQPIKDY